MTNDVEHPMESHPVPVVFVASLGHSGSTVLGLLLNGSSRTVALGEIHNYLRGAPGDRRSRVEPPCTCGATLERCEFWGPIRERCESTTVPLEAKYRLVLERAQQVFPPGTIVIDTSKTLDALAALRSATQDVRAVHLVRDVRSWTVATRDRAARAGAGDLVGLIRRHGARGLSRRIKLTGLFRFRLWRSSNAKLAAGLDTNAIRLVRTGYEQLATSPRVVLARICTALGIEFEETMLRPSPAGSHMVGGNRMRFDASKTADVLYSTRWLTRDEWLLPSLVCRSVMAYNREWVYDSEATTPVDQYR